MPDYRIRVVIDPSGINRGAGTVDRRLRKTEQRANSLRATLGRLFAAAGSGIAVNRTIRTYALFEQRISSVAAVSKATRGELALLEDETRRLGASTRFTATQAAEGAELLARAGFDAAQVLGALEGTLRLAQAGELGLAQAAGVTTSILKGFQLEVAETARVVDVLAAAAASSNTNVAQLGEAAKFVAPIAKGLNINLETTTAAIMALSNAGLQGSLAGTGLRRVMSELINPGKQLKQALDAAGVSVDEINPRMNKLTDILRTLRKVGISAEDAIAVFKQRGGPAFSVLQGFIPDLERFIRELENSGGAAEKMAKIMDDNLNGALLAVKSATEAVVLSFGKLNDENLEGFFRRLATFLRSIAKDVTVLANTIEFLAYVILVKLARGAITILIRKLAVLKAALLTNPIGLIVTGVVLATTAIAAFSDQIAVSSDGIVSLQDVFKATFEFFGRALREVGIFVQAFFIGLRKIIKQSLGVDIGKDFDEFVVNVAKSFDFILNAATGMIKGIAALFQTNTFKAIGASLLLIFKGTAFNIRITFKKLGAFLQDLFKDPVTAIARQFKRLIGAVAGVAAVARSLGFISEKTRVSIDDAATSLENLIKAGAPRKGKTPGEIEIEKLEKERDKYIKETTANIKVGQLETMEELAAILRAANGEALGGQFFEDIAKGILERSREIGEQRERERLAKLAELKKAAEQKADRPQGTTQGEAAKGLDQETQALLVQIDIYQQLEQRRKALLDIRKSEIQSVADLEENWLRLVDATKEVSTLELEEEREDALTALINRSQLAEGRLHAVTQAMIELKLETLDASTAFEAGWTRAFIRLSQEAEDFASVTEATINTFVDRSSDALADFVRNGQLSFKDLANSILDDLARIFARMLIIQALNVATGGAASLAGAGAAAGTSAVGARANGGPVNPGREYIVGEHGQERVRFGQSGTVERSEGKGESLTVVNVQDPDEIPNAMNTPEGERVVLNIMQRNRGMIKRM